MLGPRTGEAPAGRGGGGADAGGLDHEHAEGEKAEDTQDENVCGSEAVDRGVHQEELSDGEGRGLAFFCGSGHQQGGNRL